MRPRLALLVAVTTVLAVYALALAQPTPRAYLPQLGSGATPTVIVRPGMVAILAVGPRAAPDPASSQQVLLRNETTGTIFIGGWTLRNVLRPSLAPYEFPPYELAAGQTIAVISGRGPSRPDEGVFAWGIPAPIWRTGDLAEIFAADGQRVIWLVVPVIPAVPTPTLVPSGTLELNDVVLRDPAFPDISEEYAQIRNVTEDSVALADWTIRNASRPGVPAYVFPAFSLAGDMTISVFSAVGEDDLTNGDFYWDQRIDVWRVGDRAELRDPQGRLISFFIVPSQNE